MTTFDPNSTNAMFARIFARFDRQDEILEKISEQVQRTNGRVTALELANRDRENLARGRDTIVNWFYAAAGSAIMGGATLAIEFFKH